MPQKTFYITTAIDYVNARPHIGHAYEKIVADVLARWHRLKGDDVFFLTGTDENAQKNEQAAKAAGIPTQQFVDQNSQIFQDLCKALLLSNDSFIKTTEERHIQTAQAIFKTILDKGDIYKGIYKGYYCTGCEAYVTEKDLVNSKCPEHEKAPDWIEQESYFFKLSKYQSKIIALLKSKSFVLPESKRKEVLKRLETEGLKDLCVSRLNAKWGVLVPGDEHHRLYVWLDAIVNYITALDYPNGAHYKTYWPADIQLIGKGINWFHSVFWPAILYSIGAEPPKTILVHGYLTVEGKKISKSLGTAIDPFPLINRYGTDALRYFLIREIPISEDGDFSEDALKNRLNNELANDLGNLISRTQALVLKHCNGKIPKGEPDGELVEKLNLKKIEKYMKTYELHHALATIWEFVHEVNKYINERKPWENEKERKEVLYNVLDAIRIIGILVSPFIPETSGKINTFLNIGCGSYDDVKFGLLPTGTAITPLENLFTKTTLKK